MHITFGSRISRVDNITNDNCYSYAAVYGIYLNPLKLFELYRNGNLYNKYISLSLTFDFYLSDNDISNEDIGKGV